MKSPARAAFTLLELLLAIALIALLSGVLIAGSVSLLDDNPVLPEEVFWQASHAARKEALQNAALRAGHEVRLSFDAKQKAFIADDGVAPRTFPIAKASADLAVDFIPRGNGGTNPASAGSGPDQTTPMPSVTFYGDGTCNPFSVQFRTRGTSHLLEIDPWTAAQVLKAPPTTP